MLVKYKFYKIL